MRKGLRLANDGPPHRDTLALASRERSRLLVQRVLQSEDARGFPDATLDLVLVEPAHLERETHVLGCVHVRIERVVLEHHRDVPVLGRQVVDHVVVDAHGAGRDRLETGDHPQGSGLSASGWPDEYDELAVCDRQIEIADRLRPVGIDLGQVLERDLSHPPPPADVPNFTAIY